MTQADLRDAIAGAGLETLAIIPWNQRSLLAEATPTVLAEVRRTYPRANARGLAGDVRRRGRTQARVGVITLRSATMADAELLLEWANDPATRSAGFHREVIDWRRTGDGWGPPGQRRCARVHRRR